MVLGWLCRILTYGTRPSAPQIVITPADLRHPGKHGNHRAAVCLHGCCDGQD